MQKLFSTNKGTHVVPILGNNEIIAGKDSLYASATIDKKTNEVILKLVNVSGKASMQDITIEGVKKLNSNVSVNVLKADKLEDLNSINNPGVIQPKEKAMQLKGKKLALSLDPYSFNVIKIKIL